MKIIGDKLGSFAINCIKPNESTPNGRKLVNEKTFEGVWKIFVFYPNNFSYVFPEELVGFNKISEQLAKNGVLLFVGSTELQFSNMAWSIISKVETPTLHLFTDNSQEQYSLAHKLEANVNKERVIRTFCIVDDNDIIQYIKEDDLDTVSSVTSILSTLKQMSGQI